MDVHVNRMPVGGTRDEVEYHPGRFLPAYQAEAGDLNEYTEVTGSIMAASTIVVRQIVGVLARRIVCRVKEGDDVQRRRSVRRHEVRLAHGRVPAGERHDPGRRSTTRWSAA